MVGFGRFGGGSSGGGVSDHNLLNNLTYATAGHLGFASAGSVAGACQTPYRGSTLVVAASNSSAAGKACADFVCPALDALNYITTTVLPSLPAGGGKVILLEGTYTLTTANSGIFITSNDVTIEGQGKSTLLKNDAVTGDLINSTNNYTRISNMALSANGIANKCSVRITGTDASIDSIITAATNTVYFDFLLGLRCRISNCKLSSGYPVYLSSYCIASNNVIVSADIGIYFGGSQSAIAVGNSLASCVTGINESGYNNSIIGNTIITSTNPLSVAGTGVQVSGNSISTTTQSILVGSIGGNISNNSIYEVSFGAPNSFPVFTVTGSHNKVSSNKSYSGTPTYFATFSAASSNNELINNNFTGCTVGTSAFVDSGTNNKYWDNTSDVLTIGTGASTNYYVDTGGGNISGATPYICTLVTPYSDVPRNVAIQLTDATKYLTNVRVSVTGVDNLGEIKTEQFAWSTFSSLRATGNRAFMKLNSVVVQNVEPWKPANARVSVGLVATGAKLGISGRATAYTPDIIFTRRNGTNYVAPAFNATYMTLAPSTISALDEFEVQYHKNANYWSV